ncbi:MAG TPA: sugar transferase [Gaiellaceae bacterium]|nr:sugar transferase [Gaiellaceae bacterium]
MSANEVRTLAEAAAGKALAPWRRRAERRSRPSWETELATDACMLAAAVGVAEAGASQAGIPHVPVPWLVAFPLLTLLLLGARGMYQARLFLRTLDDLRIVVVTTALGAMILLSVRVLVDDDPWVAAQTARMWAFATVYLIAGRAVLAWSRLGARRRGESAVPTLVVGAGQVGRHTAARLLDHPAFGLRPIGFLDKEPLEERGTRGRLPVLGASWDLEEVVAEHGVEHVIFSFSTAPHHVILDLARRCEALGVGVSFVPRLFERMSGTIGVDHVGALPLVTAHSTDPKSWQFAVKYAVDRIAGGVLLFLLAPVLLAAALAVRLSVGRPVFFRQARVGRDGRVFQMVKFRTLRGTAAESGEADADWAVQQASGADLAGVVSADERSTRVGRFLRSYSIDELPQLWNVFVGEMSLVGLRPERAHYVELFQDRIYRYGDRHRVKSGITGWAQVNGLRGKTSLSDRVEWDNHYIENWSLWLDVKIMILTVLAVLSWRPVE